MKRSQLNQLAQMYDHSIHEVMRQNKITIGHEPSGFAIGPRFLTYDYRLAIDSVRDWQKALKSANAIQAMTLVPNITSEMNSGLIRYGIELNKQYWQNVYRSNMRGMEIGQAAGNNRIVMDWDQKSWHKLFAGTTGSGKSTLIASALCGLAAQYKPGEIEVFIADPHGDYVDNFHNFGLLGMPIATTQEDIKNLILHVFNEYTRRKANNERNKYRAILIIDECQEIEALGNSEVGFSENLTYVIPIAKGGRKFQIALWIGSQRPLQKDMPGILDMLMGKYVGVTDRAQTGTYLTGQSKLDVHKLTGDGDMVHVSPNGVIRFIAALPRERDYLTLPRVDIAQAIPNTKPIADVSKVQKSTKPGPSSICLDNAKAIGFYLAYAIVKKKLPGRQIVKNELGMSQHYHRRYDAHIRQILKYMMQYRKRFK